MINIHNIANKIIQVIKGMIEEEIIVCDTESLIIASSDKSRIGCRHEGAEEVIKRKEQLIIDKHMTKQLSGVKTGINLPLFFNRNVVGVIGITGDIEKVKPFGEIVRKMTELLINENYYTEQIEFERRSVETFIFEWLHNRALNKSLRDRADTLNIPLENKKQGIIITINDKDSILQNDVLSYLKEVIPQNDILVRWGNNRLFWIHNVLKKTPIKKSFLQMIKTKYEKYFHLQTEMGVGQIVLADEVYQTYEQSLIALKYSRKNAGVCFYSDLHLELCLQDISIQTKREFIGRTILKLNHNKSLLKTLKVFFDEELSYQRTSEKLFIHINTLHYRLSRIEEITHFNPRLFSDLIILYLAITFLDEDTNI